MVDSVRPNVLAKGLDHNYVGTITMQDMTELNRVHVLKLFMVLF